MPSELRAEASSPSRSLSLILGSYDRRTLPVLVGLKNHLAASLVDGGTPHLVLLVADVELYQFSASESNPDITGVMVEEFGKRATVFPTGPGGVLDAIDMDNPSGDPDEAARRFVSRVGGSTVRKLSVIEKVRDLGAAAADCVFVRDQELTRGGEYIELVFFVGVGQVPTKRIIFFRRAGLPVSQMLAEILNFYGMPVNDYQSLEDLHDTASRLVSDLVRNRE